MRSWLTERRIRQGRCPDCGRKLAPPLDPRRDRCHKRPMRSVVWGHGTAPTRPPRRIDRAY